MKIILVDDEQKFINMLAKRLTMRGIAADVAFSGDEAIEKIRVNNYDIAVLDIKMPGISGVHLKKEIKAIDPDIKFIFVTGHGIVAKPGADSGEKDLYLSKPLNIETLISQLDIVKNRA